jgi:predicted membrane protein DUF2214
MSTLFAFLHHLTAFTLVACIAVEFMLLRQELTPSTTRLIATHAVLGISATALLIVGLLRVFFREGLDLLLFQSRLHRQAYALHRDRAPVRDPDGRVSVLAQGVQGRAGAAAEQEEDPHRHRGGPRRVARHRAHPAVCGSDGIGERSDAVLRTTMRRICLSFSGSARSSRSFRSRCRSASCDGCAAHPAAGTRPTPRNPARKVRESRTARAI